MPLSQRIYKENVAYLHFRVLLSSKKQWHIEFCMQMDEIKKHYPEWDNSDPKRWLCYILMSGY